MLVSMLESNCITVSELLQQRLGGSLLSTGSFSRQGQQVSRSGPRHSAQALTPCLHAEMQGATALPHLRAVAMPQSVSGPLSKGPAEMAATRTAARKTFI